MNDLSPRASELFRAARAAETPLTAQKALVLASVKAKLAAGLVGGGALFTTAKLAFFIASLGVGAVTVRATQPLWASNSTQRARPAHRHPALGVTAETNGEPRAATAVVALDTATRPQVADGDASARVGAGDLTGEQRTMTGTVAARAVGTEPGDGAPLGSMADSRRGARTSASGERSSALAADEPATLKPALAAPATGIAGDSTLGARTAAGIGAAPEFDAAHQTQANGRAPRADDRCDTPHELAALKRAQAELQGAPAQALSTLDDFARECGGGRFGEERSATRALALCGAGDLAAGRAELERLQALFPQSPSLSRVRQVCSR